MSSAQAARVRCAGVLLVRGDRVLLGRRHAHRRWYPGVWDVVGGRIEDGESPLDTARREATEELDVQLATADLTRLDTVRTAELELTTFASAAWTGEVRNAAPDEHDELAWVTLPDLEHLALALPELVELARAGLATQSRTSEGRSPRR
ncbi:MAG: NUDIX hydrolase [Actinomycetota bacterium]